MSAPNNTILRNSDECFIINPQPEGMMGVATKKHISIANTLMMQKNTSPIFTGNVPYYMVNQLLEYDLALKYIFQTSQKAKNLTNWPAKSPYYPKLQKMLGQCKKQFDDPAKDIIKRINEAVSKEKEDADKDSAAEDLVKPTEEVKDGKDPK